MCISHSTDHPTSSLGNRPQASRRAPSITSADGAGPKSAHRPSKERRFAGRAKSLRICGARSSISRTLSNAESFFANPRTKFNSTVVTSHLLLLIQAQNPQITTSARSRLGKLSANRSRGHTALRSGNEWRAATCIVETRPPAQYNKRPSRRRINSAGVAQSRVSSKRLRA